MAGVLGFEPRMGDSESPALPLGDTPKRLDSIESFEFCKFFLFLFHKPYRREDISCG